MLGKIGQAKEKATRMAAILLSVMAIILGITTPSWSDFTGSFSGSYWEGYDLGFSQNIGIPYVYSTTVAAGVDFRTNNNISWTISVRLTD